MKTGWNTDTGWIGVDFDGTLANGETGAPIEAMVERVKAWLLQGIEVRILTARVADCYPLSQRNADTEYIQLWCQQHLGVMPKVTAQKDMEMYELWDDRGVTVEKNTGKQLGFPSRPLLEFVK